MADLCCSNVQLVVCRRWQCDIRPHEWHRRLAARRRRHTRSIRDIAANMSHVHVWHGVCSWWCRKSKREIVRRSDLSSLTCVFWRQTTSMWWISASDCMMWRFTADNPVTLSCIMRRYYAGLKAQVGVIGGVLLGFIDGIHKDSVRMWNLGFPRLA